MLFLFTTPKDANAPTVEETWEELIFAAGHRAAADAPKAKKQGVAKRARKRLRTLSPYCVKEKRPPWAVTQNLILEAYSKEIERRIEKAKEAAPDGKVAAKAEQEARWDANAFIDTLAHAAPFFPYPAPNLQKLDGPMAVAAREHAEFLERFGADVATYHAEREIGEKSRAGEIDGFINAWRALRAANAAPSRLVDFLAEDHLVIIQDALDRADDAGQRVGGGAYEQALRALAALAEHHELDNVKKDLDEEASKLKRPQQLPPETIGKLLPYIASEKYRTFVRTVACEAAQARDMDVSRIRAANRVASAAYVLLAVFSPAAFETIYGGVFAGKMRPTPYGERPTLVLPPYGEDLEDCLETPVIGMLNHLYDAYAQAGVSPEGLMVKPDGQKRPKPCATNSIEVFLKSIGAPFQILELRELGVAQLIWAGDDIETIARAARLEVKTARDRYLPLIELIDRLRKGP